ncbi:MAG: di-trans,poly-cis-decaprenylcistransferase [Rickettsiales bacterium]|nr:di-trans,poly-cis-decaprenylcistransferase [Rickettsiales bacterium]
MLGKLIVQSLLPAALAGLLYRIGRKGRGNSGALGGGDENFPRSLAIVMDGNGRWAKKRNLTVNMGHRRGAEVLERILEHVQRRGIRSLTLYAFSTENWERSGEEVNYLLGLVDSYLDNYFDRLSEKNVRVKIIGDLGRLSPAMREKIRGLEERTAGGDEMFLNVAFSYGGRAEIVNAAKNIAMDVKSGKLEAGDIDEELFRRYLYSPEMEYPDLVIRTGGYLRLSNFLLWQISYSELYFTNVLWPDFDEKCLDLALEEFKNRKRTYGRR